MIIYFIGTGGSEGIPAHLCMCKTCEEARRLGFAQRKPSTLAVITKNNEAILIDVGTDIRDLLHVPLKAILLTHWHHDHIYGLYKLRWMAQKTELYAPKGHADALILNDPKNLRPKTIKAGDVLKIDSLRITALKLNHEVETVGFLIEEDGERFALLYDTKGIPPETLDILKKKPPRVAVVDATYAPGVDDPYHNNVDEGAEIGLEVAEKVYLSHISHRNLPFLQLLTYVKKRYGDRVRVAYDGLIVNI